MVCYHKLTAEQKKGDDIRQCEGRCELRELFNSDFPNNDAEYCKECSTFEGCIICGEDNEFDPEEQPYTCTKCEHRHNYCAVCTRRHLEPKCPWCSKDCESCKPYVKKDECEGLWLPETHVSGCWECSKLVECNQCAKEFDPSQLAEGTCKKCVFSKYNKLKRILKIEDDGPNKKLKQ